MGRIIVLLLCFTGSLLAEDVVGHYVFLSPIREATIRSRTDAPVLEVNKRLGDSFEADEVLIQLDSRVAQARHSKAFALVKKAVRDLVIQKELFEEGAGSLVALNEAKANLAVAESDLVEAKDQLDACQILVPFQGAVVDVFIHAHETPAKGQDLISVLDDSEFVGKVLIPSERLRHLSLGDPVSLRLKELDTWIQGTVYRIGAAIDPSSSTVKIEILVPNPDRVLKAGMSGRVRFEEEVSL